MRFTSQSKRTGKLRSGAMGKEQQKRERTMTPLPVQNCHLIWRTKQEMMKKAVSLEEG